MKVACYTPDRFTCETTGHGRPSTQTIYTDVVRLHAQNGRDGMSLSVTTSKGKSMFGMVVGELAISLDENEVYIGQL